MKKTLLATGALGMMLLFARPADAQFWDNFWRGPSHGWHPGHFIESLTDPWHNWRYWDDYGYGYGSYYYDDYGYDRGSYYAPGYTSSTNSSAALIESLPPDRARVYIIVPDPTAEVTMSGAPTHTLGRTRYYDSPSLEPGHQYFYRVQATWNVNGKRVTDMRVVNVAPGTISRADFTRPAPPDHAPPPEKKAAAK